MSVIFSRNHVPITNTKTYWGSLLALQMKADGSSHLGRETQLGYRETILKLKDGLKGGLDYER